MTNDILGSENLDPLYTVTMFCLSQQMMPGHKHAVTLGSGLAVFRWKSPCHDCGRRHYNIQVVEPNVAHAPIDGAL